ncbi:helix-turn-helix transcriptional regulator [Streptomyces sp. AgN23]|uniref:helix-turn-helix domain-containing protein n=1 Tax=Streptomyces sp. AgN23 TaxID=1188315 RepID=UPI001B31A96D|nr:helix-turn-helix transcriptional regulator [Streptomyces sp. AgN23]QTI88552.1 helix-turn-helix transcriptional regulator [Streptomyces sp. AgN23]
MPQSIEEHTGACIARTRRERDLTQQGLAMRANVSKSLLSKVECGQRPASPSLIAACARALSVTTSDLLGQPYTQELRRERLDEVIQPIRVSMENWDIPLDWQVPARPVALIRADMEKVLVQRRQAEYLPMAVDLPALIDECVQAIHTTSGEERRQAHECLAWAFRCVFTLAWSFGYVDLATVALQRLDWAAPRADEPGLAAMYGYLRAQTTLSSSRYDLGMRIVDSSLRDLEGQASRSAEGLAAMAGVLQLRAAVIAGRMKDPDQVEARVTEARELAERTGETSAYGVGWGPTNVGVHAIAIACDLEEYDQAVQLADDVRFPKRWDRSRAGHHWLDLSRANVWTGDSAQALDCLQKARRTAPQQTRYHPTTRETVIALRSRERSRGSELAEFAGWIGL